MDNIIRKGQIHVNPLVGKIAGGERSRINVTFCPGLPGDYIETFKIQIAHFEPETITLKGYSNYPALKQDLPRIKTPEFTKRLIAEKSLEYSGTGDDAEKSCYSRVLDNETVSEIDRKILSEAIMKNIEAREAGAISADTSYADVKSEKKAGLGDTQIVQSQVGQSTTQEGFGTGDKPNMTERSGFQKNLGGSLSMRYEKRLIERVIVGVYTLDLGNVVAGLSAKKSFKIWNVGKLMITTLMFDAKAIKAAGFSLSHDKLTRFGFKDHNCVTLELKYQTKKSTTPGKAKYFLPMEIANGPKYMLEIVCNVTVPDIKVSSSDIDFGCVICGQRKTVFIRFENQKEVPCEWNLNLKEDRPSGDREKKQEPRFHLSPQSGVMPKYTNSTLEITFIPLTDKLYQQKFSIEIKDNQRKVEIFVKGLGTTPNLEFFPPEMEFMPSLPYNETVLKTMEIKNKSDFDVELFCLDFDKQFIQEDKWLQNYDALNTKETLFVDVRSASMEFWPHIIEACAQKDQIDKIEKEIEELKANPEAEDRDERIKQLEEEKPKPMEEPVYPMKLDDDRKVHFVIFGPPGVGKTALVKNIHKKHERGIVNMDELYDWNINHKTEAGIAAKEAIEARNEEREAYAAEKDKERKKKNPPKKGEVQPPINTDHFDWLDHNIVTNLVAERIKFPDCNAGVVFDNLKSRYWENELVALQAISKACDTAQVQLVNLTNIKDSKGFEQTHIIDTNAIKTFLGLNEPEQPVLVKEPEVEQPPQKGNKGGGRGGPKKGNNPPRGSTRQKSGKKDDKAAIVPVEPPKEDEPPKVLDVDLFELNIPKEQTPEEKEYYDKIQPFIYTLWAGQLPVEEIYKFNKIQEAEEKNKGGKAAKGKKGAEPEPEEPKYEAVSQDQIRSMELPDRRSYVEVPIIYNHLAMSQKALEVLPSPDFPDPQTLPIPDPFIQQILKKQPPKKPRKEPANFELLTPKDIFVKEEYVNDIIEKEFAEEKVEFETKVKELEEAFTQKEEKIQAELEEKKRLEEEQAEQEKNDDDKAKSPGKESQDEALDKTGKTGQQQSQSKVEELGEDNQNPNDQTTNQQDTTEDKGPTLHPELQKIQDELDEVTKNYNEKLKARRQELMADQGPSFTMEQLEKQTTRWIIPANKSIYLVVRFFSKSKDTYEGVLEFTRVVKRRIEILIVFLKKV